METGSEIPWPVWFYEGDPVDATGGDVPEGDGGNAEDVKDRAAPDAPMPEATEIAVNRFPFASTYYRECRDYHGRILAAHPVTHDLLVLIRDDIDARMRLALCSDNVLRALQASGNKVGNELCRYLSKAAHVCRSFCDLDVSPDKSSFYSAVDASGSNKRRRADSGGSGQPSKRHRVGPSEAAAK